MLKWYNCNLPFAESRIMEAGHVYYACWFPSNANYASLKKILRRFHWSKEIDFGGVGGGYL
jgi:hypothetical protein